MDLKILHMILKRDSKITEYTQIDLKALTRDIKNSEHTQISSNAVHMALNRDSNYKTRNMSAASTSIVVIPIRPVLFHFRRPLDGHEGIYGNAPQPLIRDAFGFLAVVIAN